MPKPPPDEIYRAVTKLFATTIFGFGLAIVIVTLANGGGPTSTGRPSRPGGARRSAR